MDSAVKHNKPKNYNLKYNILLLPPLWPDTCTSLIRRKVQVEYLQSGEVLSAVLVDFQS